MKIGQRCQVASQAGIWMVRRQAYVPRLWVLVNVEPGTGEVIVVHDNRLADADQLPLTSDTPSMPPPS